MFYLVLIFTKVTEAQSCKGQIALQVPTVIPITFTFFLDVFSALETDSFETHQHIFVGYVSFFFF